ncbi:hypothetical protein A7K94_0217480 [Modestobacter sp. VKM Ac-2676]|nr:hypothetical protein A7K94_0217480 [Modestobacter sp. VKM Ac-2676]
MQHTGSSAAVAEAPGPEPSARRRPVVTLVSIAVAAVVSALIFLVVHRSLIDDAYITLSYARNLAEHFHWGLTEYRTANSATSPLNVVLLALGAFILRDPIWGLGLVFVVLNVLQVWGLTRLAAHLGLARGTGLVAWLVVALSPLMLAIVGMEMTLAVTLVVWLALAALTSRAVAFGLLTAALLLTRVDLLVFPVVLLLATRGLWRRAPVAIGTAVLAALPGTCSAGWRWARSSPTPWSSRPATTSPGGRGRSGTAHCSTCAPTRPRRRSP